MATRTTRAYLDAITERLNKVAGTPTTYWATPADAADRKTAIGHFHVESVYPNQYRLVQTVSTGGATRNVTPARPIAIAAELIHAYREGFEEAKKVAA